MHAQVSVLQAIRHSDEPATQEPKTLHLHWPLTHGAMDALQSLPNWPWNIDLTECSFPLQPGEYKRMAKCIPSTFRSISLPATEAARALGQHVEQGAHECGRGAESEIQLSVVYV